MPPKKRRGGAAARARRGRATRKTAQASTALEVIASPVTSPAQEQTETSSSNSSPSVFEESAQPEAKIKLETKIHKKFGIKYHVPDEVVAVKSLSPVVEDVSNTVLESPATEIALEDESTQTLSLTEEALEKMEIDASTECVSVDGAVPVAVSVIQENFVENIIAEQMHHLEVTESEVVTELDDMGSVEMHEVEEVHDIQEIELETGVVLEYVTHEQDHDVEGSAEVESQDETEEVYYVLEDDSQDTAEAEHVEQKESVIVQNDQVEEKVGIAVDKLPAEMVKIESSVQFLAEMPKEKKKDDKVKAADKPCRKSKRISSRGGQNVEDKVLLKVGSSEELKLEADEEPVTPDSTLTTEVKVEDIKTEETLMEVTPIEEFKDSIEETLTAVINSSVAEVEETKKGVKKQPAEKKKWVSRTKKTKDIGKDGNDAKEEKKKGKKQGTSKMQAKGKKPTDAKDAKTDKTDEEDTNIRRSSRIKTISTQKVRARGKGLVKKDDVPEMLSTPGTPDDKSVFVAPTSTTDVEHKPVKVKSRWRRSSELEMRDIVKTPLADSPVNDKDIEKKKTDADEVERRLKQFLHLKENVYLTERISCKEAKKMVCDCFLTEEEIGQGEYGCGDDCLNRLLMIECGNLCTVGDRCTNKRFQKMQSAIVEAFATERKGLGIRAAANIPSGDFILEYVGEVLDAEKFEQRAAEYSKDKNQHYYFMALRADAIIDATVKGNISRFINHSCDPNAETQKWTVNGELRIGFFSKRTILAGEEITFDYQFQRYGKEAQKCFCESANCRGWLGEEPDSEDESDDDEDEDDDEEEEEEEEKERQEPESDLKEAQEERTGEEEEVEAEAQAKPSVKKVHKKKEKLPKKEKKEKRQLKPRRKPRMDRFEDLGLDEEIESLQATGLKNQAQTLKLSRLMVRAKEPVQRTKLLKLLKKGEFPCRRLFLDYHGLRLIHGWMTDAQHLAQQDATMECLRLEILQTLAMLPIPNKTMLQDSKVLPTVDKWSKEAESRESPVDSDSNSPKEVEGVAGSSNQDERIKPFKSDGTDAEEKETKEATGTEEVSSTSQAPTAEETPAVHVEAEDEFRKSTGMEASYFKVIPDYNVDSIREELLIIFDSDFAPLEMPAPKAKPVQPVQSKYDILVEIMALALKLLEEWASLKEVFRIPKKERIEQMKEHEREADRRYKALSVEQETERRRDRYRGFQRPARIEVADRERLLSKERERERERERDRIKAERYSALQPVGITKMSKQERRELFARQAEEEERRRKQELWSKQNWVVMGQDPRTQGYDATRAHPNVQVVWNPQIGQYQNVIADASIPGGFSFAPGMLPPNVAQPTMPPANMGSMPPMPNIPPRPGAPYQEEAGDPAKVQFMGPIPPPVKLPPKWKSAKDKYGRPYYYHVKLRVSQWLPPEVADAPEESDEFDSESTSSSDTSSLTSSSSSEDSDSEDDAKLMMDIRNKFKQMEAQKQQQHQQQPPATKKEEDVSKPLIAAEEETAAALVAAAPPPTPVPVPVPVPLPLTALNDSILPIDDMSISDISVMTAMMDRSMAEEAASPLEGQLADALPTKKRRIGLVQEHIISPRTEEDRLQFREDVKKYKQNKEMVRKEKEVILQQAKKTVKPSTSIVAPPTNGDKQKLHKKKVSSRSKLKEMEANTNSEDSKKIKETFRTAMATVMVNILNPYRKPDCKEGRIATTDDFKHLARKLTHFVMLKELKHCDRIEDLECTESVKAKAKEFVRKYMAKFGEMYQRPVDETDTF